MILNPTIAKAFKPIGKIGYAIAKNSPKILTAFGITCYAGSVAFATGAPRKAEEARDLYLKDHDRKKFIRGYVKAWAPTIGLFAAGTGSVLWGHGILHGRYVATGAALTATRKAFKEYRDRVIAKEGEKADICYRYGMEETIDLKDGTDGKEAEVVHQLEQVAPVDPKDYYIYIFDERNEKYMEGDDAGNIARMKLVLQELNCIFDASLDGRVTLKDALIKSGFRYALGDKKLAKFAGRVGWNKDSDRGDGYISFGPMFEAILKDPRDYIMGRTPPLIIEFNCDGDIYG